MSHIAEDSAEHAGQDQDWADRLLPDRRRLLMGGLVTTGALASASWPGKPLPLRPSTVSGKSVWGYHTARQPTPPPTVPIET